MPGDPEDRKAGAPAWLTGAESVGVLKVEKMDGTLKALAQFKSGRKITTKYAMLRKNDDGNYRVAGFL